MKNLLFRYIQSCGLLLAMIITPAWANNQAVIQSDEITINAHDEIDLPVTRYAATGEYLLIWVGSGYGFSQRTEQMAHAFAQNQLETWQIEFSAALFQPNGSNFMRNLNAEYVADLIEAAHQQTGKKIALLSHSYGAIPILRGITLWQQRNQKQAHVVGAVLVSPDLVSSIPSLGLDPEYLPITRHTNMPIFILQAQRRGNQWQLPRLLAQLRQRNPHVYFSQMESVSGLFFDSDLHPDTLRKIASLPKEMPGLIRLLAATQWNTAPNQFHVSGKTYQSKLDDQLKPYRSHPIPPQLALTDIHGKKIIRTDYRNKVTVVNFWATWCPPCVEEIPSLNRLMEKMQNENFELISINYAEPTEQVRTFMKNVKVDFPVLMDEQGTTSKQWNVIAFPSTFIIGKDGQIKYGVNAAISWDSPEVIKKLKALSTN